MSGLWTWGIDNEGQPLLDAYWTPGWTSQNDSYVQVPPNQFMAYGFPSGLTYATVIGNYFDTSANPLSGYMTFWPSSPLTFNTSGSITYMPQRYAGTNQTLLGLNQMGDGKIYLWYGQLSVTLLATDNSNMTPVSFTYHVKEHYKERLQYDITVPSSDSSSAIDIHNLIIPGSVRPVSFEDPYAPEDSEAFISIPVTSSQYLAADISTIAAGLGFNPTSYEVDFAFISGPSQPQSSQWIPGSWNNSMTPYIAQIMIGPNGTSLSQGSYKVWARVIASPQVPVIPVGYLTIY